MAKGRDVNWRDNDSLTGPGRSFRQDSAVEVYDLAPSWPRIRRRKLQAGSLIGGRYIGDVLERPAPVDYGPPVHWLGRPPRVHVSRYPYQYFRAIRRQLADRLRKDPVIAYGAAKLADRRIRDRE